MNRHAAGDADRFVWPRRGHVACHVALVTECLPNRHRPASLVPLLLAVLTFTSSPVGARPVDLSPERRLEVKAMVREAVAADLPVTGDQLLTEFGAVPLGPGAFVIGRALPHEIESTRRIGRVFAEKFESSLVLVANVDEWSVPAFDGVILNRSREIIGNFSLKTYGPRAEGYGLEEAMGLAVQYSKRPSWLGHIVRPPFHAPVVDPLEHKILAHRTMMRIFLPPQPRATTILVDQAGAGPLGRAMVGNAVMASSYRPLVPGILVLRDDRLVTFMVGKMATVPLGPCEVDLVAAE